LHRRRRIVEVLAAPLIDRDAGPIQQGVAVLVGLDQGVEALRVGVVLMGVLRERRLDGQDVNLNP